MEGMFAARVYVTQGRVRKATRQGRFGSYLLYRDQVAPQPVHDGQVRQCGQSKWWCRRQAQEARGGRRRVDDDEVGVIFASSATNKE